jgi:hypothetical protein
MNPDIRIAYTNLSEDQLGERIAELLNADKHRKVREFFQANRKVNNLSKPNKGNGHSLSVLKKLWQRNGVKRQTAWFQLTGEVAVWTNYQVPHPCPSCECLKTQQLIRACGDEGTHHLSFGYLGVLPGADVLPHEEYPPSSGRLPGSQAVGVPFGSMGQKPPRAIDHVPPQLPTSPEIMAQSLTPCIICRAVATYFLWDYICKNRPGLLKPLKRLVKQYLPPLPIFPHNEFPWSNNDDGFWITYKEERLAIYSAEKHEKKRSKELLKKLHDQWLRYFPVQVTAQSQLRNLGLFAFSNFYCSS